LLAFILAGTFVAKVWFIPGVIRYRIQSGLSKVWDEAAVVEAVRFRYFGPTEVGSIAIEDTDGRRLLAVSGIKLWLSTWPEPYKRVTALEIDRLECRMRAERCRQLFGAGAMSGRSSLAGSRLLDLRRLSVADGALILCTEDSESSFEGLELDINEKAGVYRTVLTQALPGNLRTFSLSAVTEKDGLETEARLELNRFFSRDFVGFVLRVLGISPEYEGKGDVAAEVTVSGSLKDVNSISATGKGQFSDWTIYSKDAAIAEDVNFGVQVDRSRCDIENLSGVFCGGQLTGRLQCDGVGTEDHTYSGELSISGVDLVQVGEKLERQWHFTKGRCSAEYIFFWEAGGLEALEGTGVIVVDDADLSAIGVIGELFGRIGLAKYDPLRVSDAVVSFRMAGSEVVIEEAMVSNRLAALRAEAGGRVDLRSGQLDINVIAVPLKQVDELIRATPVLNIIGGLKDKLVRLKVRGHWSEPAGKLITKEPVQDVKDGTVGFLRDIVESGGQITQNMRQRVSDIVRRVRKKEAAAE
jgi:hypothetical protein